VEAVEEAARALAGVDTVAPGDAPRYRLVAARLALAQGEPGRALQFLSGDTTELPAESLYRLRAEAHEQRGRPLKAAANLARLFARLAPEQRADLYRRLWGLLDAAALDQLRQVELPEQHPLTGWVELAIIDKTMLSTPEDWNIAVDFWLEQYPDHAARDFLPQLRQRNRRLYPRPTRIALLLPAAGPFVEAAEAVTDGILAAWYRGKVPRPELQFYDTHGQDVHALLEQAVAAGADFIIGPLVREQVDALALRGDVPVDVLALNRAGIPPREQPAHAHRFIQFHLSVEDEVRQVAERAWFDGHARALLIIPRSPWGQRVYDAFTRAWSRLGGAVLASVNYAPGPDYDHAAGVQRLLNADRSQWRIQRLRQVLQRDVQSWVRGRQDPDFIFLAADPENARQFLPQLSYFSAAELPVYATPRIYDGRTDSEGNRDLEQIIFPDMPWNLDPASVPGGTDRSLRDYRSGVSVELRRLFAFGMDAYGLIHHLGAMAANRTGYRYQGASGLLSLSVEGIIERSLQWGRLQAGIPRLLDQDASSADP